MTDVTHAFEDLLLEFRLTGVVVAGFTDINEWEVKRSRYERIAASTDLTVGVFGAGRLAPAHGVQTFQLDDRHPLAGLRFLLASTPMTSATLFVTELPGLDDDTGEERSLRAVWTFDPSVCADVAAAAIELAGEGAPDLARFLAASMEAAPPAPMTHAFGQRYSVALIEQFEATRRRWRDLSVELAAARRELEDRGQRERKLERLASIGSLSASVAHELNNPLASITMAANVLSHLDDPEERAHLAGIVESEALRAGRIAGDLLAFAADRELDLTTTRLDAWLEEVAAGYRANGNPVTVNASSARITADVDIDRLRQVIANLVDNAIAAIGSDGRVELELALVDGEIRISVTDDGCGVAEAIRPRIFDPFTTSKPRGQGTGLGLAIARAHAQDHGGDLELVDTGPSGTRFMLRVPGSDAVTAGPPITARQLAVDPAALRTEEGAGTVLVVDDEPPIRALLETLLRRNGWKVRTASGLSEAVKAARSGPIDFALIDVQLGRHNGPAVLAELERLRPGMSERSAFVTGAPPESGLIDGIPVLGKPFSWNDLSQMLERLTTS